MRPRAVATAQLVRIEKPPDDGDDGDDGDQEPEGTILSVSQVEDADGRTMEATGRSVASVQFMITRAMRAQLHELGYSAEDIIRQAAHLGTVMTVARGVRARRDRAVLSTDVFAGQGRTQWMILLILAHLESK